MNDRNRKEMILSLVLATACSGTTVDLGHGGGGEWRDAPEGGGALDEPHTILDWDFRQIRRTPLLGTTNDEVRQ